MVFLVLCLVLEYTSKPEIIIKSVGITPEKLDEIKKEMLA